MHRVPFVANGEYLFRGLSLREMIKLSHTSRQLKQDFDGVIEQYLHDINFLIVNLAIEIYNGSENKDAIDAENDSVDRIRNCLAYSLNNQTVNGTLYRVKGNALGRVTFGVSNDPQHRRDYIMFYFDNGPRAHGGYVNFTRHTNNVLYSGPLDNLGVFLLHKVLQYRGTDDLPVDVDFSAFLTDEGIFSGYY